MKTFLALALLTVTLPVFAEGDANSNAAPAAPAAPSAPAAPATQPNPAAQQKVWKAEEGMVSVLLEMSNQELKLIQVVQAQDAYFAGVSGPFAVYKQMAAAAVAAQQKLVALGVMRSIGNDDYRFSHQNRAPSDEAKKALEAYMEAIGAFEQAPESQLVLMSMMGRVRKDQNDIPPALKDAFGQYVGFARNFQQVQQAAGLLLGKAIQENGGQFNSRWGLE